MNLGNAIIFISLGVLHVLVGLITAGAGHGWVTGLFFSPVSLMLYPLAGYALIKRDKIISLVVMSGSVLMTVMLIVVISNNVEYYLRAWEILPFLMTCYFLLWTGWPLVALLGLIKGKK